MKELSIIIRAEFDKLMEYLEALEPILTDPVCELIIINNSLKKIDTKYSCSLYKFEGSGSKFKEFCFSSSCGNRMLIIDGSMELTPDIVNDFILNIKNSDFRNTAYKFRRFLSLNRPIYYTEEEVLIYNRGIKGFNNTSNITIDDFTLLDVNSLENSLSRFIERKCFCELYLWYKHFILKQPDDLKHRFYLLLENEKLGLADEDVINIEELFISGNEDIHYCEYLKTMEGIFKTNSLNEVQTAKKINSLPSLSNSMYFSYLIYKIIKDRQDMYKIIFKTNMNFLRAIMDYLLCFNNFHGYLYNFLLKVNQNQKINEKIKLSKTNILLVNSYIACASSLETDPEINNNLIRLFEIYIGIIRKLIVNKNNQNSLLEDSNEKDLHDQYEKALIYLKEGDINKAAETLKSLSSKYPIYERILRYLIQKIRFENSCYKYLFSICMIVKDEEKNLGRCLESIKPLIDLGSELIIVDTGSTDRTVEIAMKYTKNIYFYKWNGSFSAARNYSISAAEGRYIFLLDSDEEISSGEIERILEVFKVSDDWAYNTCTLKIKNYTDVSLTEYAIITQPRIFRNDTEFYYSGKVHNQPVYRQPALHLPIYIIHYGYIMTEDIKDKKFLRTANMLKAELQKNPKNIYYRFQLSTSYAMHGDLKEALNQAEIYMRKIKSEKLAGNDYLMYYNNAAILYISSHLLEEALDICDEALNISPKFIDFIYYKALICYETGEYESALKYTDKYLKLVDNFMDIDIASDGRFSFYTLGLKNDVAKMEILCHHKLGEYKEIIDIFSMLEPSSCRECLHAILNAYLKTGRYSDTVRLYNSLCTDNKSKLIFRYFLEYYIGKSDNGERLLCQGILTTLNCYEDHREELKDNINLKDITSTIDPLFIIENYDIDSLTLSESKELFNRLLPLYNSFNVENAAINEVAAFRKLGLCILKRSYELKRFKDYAPAKQINILSKYIKLSSILIKKGASGLIEVREQLFLIKATDAFKLLRTPNLQESIKLLRESAQIFRPMEGIVELIIKNIIPDSKKTSNNINSITVVGDNSQNINSYADVVKEKIAELSNKTPRDMLEVFSKYNSRDMYDPELFSYKAVLLMSEAMFHEAGFEIKEGLSKYPNEARLLSNLSRLYSFTHRYKEAAEVFFRAKLLYGDKCSLDINELIPDSSVYDRPFELRVLHGTMFGNNKVNKIVSELSKRGIYVKTLSYCPKFTGYASDYVIDMNQYEDGNVIIERTIDAASNLIPEFNIFHFHFGSSLTFDYSDLPVLSEFNKKIVFELQEDEVDSPENDNNPPTASKDKNFALLRKLSVFSKYADCCIVPNEELSLYVRDYFKEIHIIKEDEIDKLINLYRTLAGNRQ